MGIIPVPGQGQPALAADSHTVLTGSKPGAENRNEAPLGAYEQEKMSGPVPGPIVETASTIPFTCLIVFLVLLVFATTPGILAAAGTLTSLAASVPILPVTSLILLLPRPATGGKRPETLEPAAHPHPQPRAIPPDDITGK